MFSCCLYQQKDKDCLVESDNIPELDKIDIIKNPPEDNSRCERWGEYLFELNGWNIESYKKIFFKLDSLAKNFLLVKTMGRYIYNYRNCKKTIKKLKKRERIQREILALKKLGRQ